MSKNDLGIQGRFASAIHRRRRSRGKIGAAAFSIVLVVGPSFLGATASIRSPRAIAPTAEATTKRGPALKSAGHAASPAFRGLFSVQARGVVTQPIFRAAERFLATIPSGQAGRAPFPIGAGDWLDQMGVPSESPERLPLKTMTSAQHAAAITLIRDSLGAEGLSSDEAIVKLKVALGNLDGGATISHFTVLGQPSADQPWGWQLEGPQFVAHYFVLGDQVTMTPTCLDLEPASHLPLTTAQIRP